MANMQYHLYDRSNNYLSSGYETVATTMTERLTHSDHVDIVSSSASPDSASLKNVMNSLKSLYGSNKFVKGHLLNAKFGGSQYYDNLFPITYAANSQHKSQIENKIDNFLEYTKPRSSLDQNSRIKSALATLFEKPETGVFTDVSGEITYTVDITPNTGLDTKTPGCQIAYSVSSHTQYGGAALTRNGTITSTPPVRQIP